MTSTNSESGAETVSVSKYLSADSEILQIFSGGISELFEKFDKQDQRIADLEAENADMRSRLDDLEQDRADS
jgi:hypothetical protein